MSRSASCVSRTALFPLMGVLVLNMIGFAQSICLPGYMNLSTTVSTTAFIGNAYNMTGFNITNATAAMNATNTSWMQTVYNGSFITSSTTTFACALCPPGYYNGTDGICTPCDAGTYSSVSYATACTLCPMGTEQPLPGQSGCAACQAGSFAEQTCIGCPPSQCTQCIPGTFSNTTGASACSRCVDPAWNYHSGSSTCITCAAGSYLFDRDCLPCPPGKVSRAPGFKHTCDVCASIENFWYYQPNAGQSSCLRCMTGSIPGTAVSPDFCSLDCPAGNFYKNVGALGVTDFDCLPCPLGRIAPSSQTSMCQTCPTNGTIPAADRTRCIACPVGTFAIPGFTACATCPLGRFADTPSMGSCAFCAGGAFPDAQATSCISCLAGTFATPGFTTCQTCQPGTFTAVTRTSACSTCTAGCYPDASRTRCDVCPIGTYSLSGFSTCTACQRGSFSLSNATANCTLCPIGTEWVASDAVCKSCSINFYSNVPGSAVCLPCPRGFYQPVNQTDRTFCIPVPPPPPTPFPLGARSTAFTVRIRFLTDPTTATSAAFQRACAALIAAALGAVPSRVGFGSVTAGSALIDVLLFPVDASAPGAASPQALAAALVLQARNATSQLARALVVALLPAVDATFVPVVSSAPVVQCWPGVWVDQCNVTATSAPASVAPYLYNPDAPRTWIFYVMYVGLPCLLVLCTVICCCASEECLWHAECIGCFGCVCPCVDKIIKRNAAKRKRAMAAVMSIGMSSGVDAAPTDASPYTQPAAAASRYAVDANPFDSAGGRAAGATTILDEHGEPIDALSPLRSARDKDRDSRVKRERAAMFRRLQQEATAIEMSRTTAAGGAGATRWQPPSAAEVAQRIAQYRIRPDISDDSDV